MSHSQRWHTHRHTYWRNQALCDETCSLFSDSLQMCQTCREFTQRKSWNKKWNILHTLYIKHGQLQTWLAAVALCILNSICFKWPNVESVLLVLSSLKPYCSQRVAGSIHRIITIMVFSTVLMRGWDVFFLLVHRSLFLAIHWDKILSTLTWEL